jgi:hypothetical protein
MPGRLNLNPKWPFWNTTKFPPSPVTNQVLVVGQAVETDTAQAVTVTTTESPSISASKRPYVPFTAEPLPNTSRIVKVTLGANLINVGQAVETDTAQAVTVTTAEHPSISASKRPYVPFTADPLPNRSRILFREGKTIAVGQAVETDTAQAVTVTLTQHPSIKALKGYTPFTADPLPNKSRIVSSPGIPPLTISVGQATETDTASAVTVSTTEHQSIKPILARGFTTEPLPNKSRLLKGYNPPQFIAVGQATETDTAQAVSAVLTDKPAKVTKAIGFSTAQLPNRSRIIVQLNQTVQVGQAVETDTAQAVQSVLRQPSILPTIARGHIKPELPNRSRLVYRFAISISVGQATETDTAAAVTVQITSHPPVKPVQYKAHTAEPLRNRSRTFKGFNPSQTIVVGQALETDSAQSIKANQILHVGQAIETDSASAITVVLPVSQKGRCIRGLEPYHRPEPPYLSRTIEPPYPTILPSIGKTIVSAGLHADRLRTQVGDEIVTTIEPKTRVSGKAGDVSIDARLRRNRVQGDG